MAAEMMTGGVAWRYANALFNLAKEENAIPATARALQSLSAGIASSADLQRLFASPVFKADEQISAITALTATGGLSGLAMNFIKLLCRNRRASLVPEAIRAFQTRVDQDKGEVVAQVTSAEKLSSTQLKELAAALKTRFGQEVRLHTKVDTSLLGGLTVQIGSTLIDDALKTKLQKLKIAMKGTG